MKSIVIGVAGGTGSGKSTFTNRIKKEFGDNISVIYHDNYYRSRNDLKFEQRKGINYDHPDALETDLLIKHIEALKAGQRVLSPIYDYTLHNRSKMTNEIIPSPVIIVEGILVLQNEPLCNLLDVKVYVEADADERILRRILRDMKERGRGLQEIINQYLTTVKPMHSLYVEPTKVKADIIINSGKNDVAYSMIKNQIEHYLRQGD